ncbi:acyltransferase [Treponema pedis]|uniref:acyltransferase n=1 Tax=Treponema pedis TaxID=409322 RepID=UPI003D1DF03B
MKSPEIVAVDNLEKESYFQAIRGICICAVIFIHCLSGSNYKNVQDANVINYYWWIFSRQFLNFPVAVFFFLSGYFINLQQAEANPFYWMRKRFIKLGLPFLIWSLFYLMLNLFMNQNILYPKDILKLFILFFVGKSSYHLYFVFVLLQLSLLTVLFIKSKFFFNCAIFISVLWYIIRYFAIFFKLNSFLEYSGIFFPAWCLFYLYGIHVKRNGIKKISIEKVFIMLITTIIINYTETIILFKGDVPDSFIITQVKISSVLYSFAIIISIMSFYSNIYFDNWFIFKKIGNNSFGIYFIHVFFINIFIKAENHIHIMMGGGGVLSLTRVIEFIFVLSASIISIIGLKRILGKKKSLVFLGC